MEEPFEVSAILRPRRFSLNLSMLKSFLSIGPAPSDFDRFLIANEKEFVSKHCGQYPVVFLDLKDCKGETWKEMYKAAWRRIGIMVLRHSEDISLEIGELKSYGIDFKNPTAYGDEGIVSDSLAWLMSSLNKKYKRRVMVLVDEYDAPLNHAFRKGYYDQASSFFGSFYSQALKGNSALKKACLMGIVEVRGAGILSGLNNLSVDSVFQEEYQSFFGFSTDEIHTMLRSIGRDGLFNEVMNWYNGYHIGTVTVINPWSFMNWLQKRKFGPYWVKTSYTETISTILGPHLKTELIDMILALMSKYRLRTSHLETQVNYTKENWNLDSIIHFLVLTGYLTYAKQECNDFGEVWIPNQEVLSQWNSDIVMLLNESFAPIFKDKLFKIFSSQDFDSAALQDAMQNMLLHCSSHDVNRRNESSYHMFFFGVFFALFHGVEIEVTTNRETGHGRNDIKILFVPLKKCFIFEFKLSRTESALDGDAQNGLEQIINKRYATESLDKGYSCIGVGIACYKKKLSQLKCDRITK